MELTKQSSGLLCKLVIYYYIFVIYYYIFHDRSNASIAGDRDLRSPAIDALLSVAPAHPARNLDMHLCWHVHPSNVKNLVVDEEKSVLNHQTHNACQTEDQCQSGARRGYAYRAPHITAVPRAQHTCSSCSGSKRNAHLNSSSSRPIRTSARLRPCRASSWSLFSAHLPGSGLGVCESEKTTRERRARVRWEVRTARTGAADLERIGEDNCGHWTM